MAVVVAAESAEYRRPSVAARRCHGRPLTLTVTVQTKKRHGLHGVVVQAGQLRSEPAVRLATAAIRRARSLGWEVAPTPACVGGKEACAQAPRAGSPARRREARAPGARPPCLLLAAFSFALPGPLRAGCGAAGIRC